MEREQLKNKRQKANRSNADQKDNKPHQSTGETGMNALQQKIGNRAVQRLVAQRNSDNPTRIDDQVSQRINQARSDGEALQPDVQKQMGQGLNADLSQVRVHTSQESHELNQALGAKAFTTGKDIFFKEGAYDPNTSSGKELIAHELTHVVQQDTGQVHHSSSGMTVNAPGDAYEQQADQAAKALVRANNEASTGNSEVARIQREIMPGLDIVNRQEENEEEELVQAQEEEEIELQMQTEQDEEEEELQAKRG